MQDASNEPPDFGTSSAPTPHDPRRPQNVQIAVVAFDLEVAIVWSVPPIDVFDDFDRARIEPKAHRHFDAEIASTMLDLYLHIFLLPRMFSRRCPIIGLSAASRFLSLATVEHGATGGAEIAPVMGHAG
jgi:hypothetical protein